LKYRAGCAPYHTFQSHMRAVKAAQWLGLVHALPPSRMAMEVRASICVAVVVVAAERAGLVMSVVQTVWVIACEDVAGLAVVEDARRKVAEKGRCGML
jgi:hypothetical protein